jgi:hypothetical protein
MDGIERPTHHSQPAKLLLHDVPAYWSTRAGPIRQLIPAMCVTSGGSVV